MQQFPIRHKRSVFTSPTAVLLCAAILLGGCSANRDKLKIKTACDISGARPANPNGSVLVTARLTPDAPAAAQALPQKPAILFAEPPSGIVPESPGASGTNDATQVPAVEVPEARSDQPKTALRESGSADHVSQSSINKGC